MTSGRAKSRLAQLWQFPLFLFSLGLFGYAGYLFINPIGGPTPGQRLDVARKLLRQDRPDAAIPLINELLEGGKLKPVQEGAARMLLGEALELAQKQSHLSLRANHERIIQQTRLAMSMGITADIDVFRRLADSYEAIGRLDDAIEHCRRAKEKDPTQSIKWQRRIIELHFAQDKPDAAAEAIDQYLKEPGLAESERAWALGERSHVLIDRGSYKEARDLLAEAIKLNQNAETELGRFNYWLGYCAWRLGEADQAERHLRVARDLLKTQHPLDAEAAYLLGKLRLEHKDYTVAASFFDAVLASHMDSKTAMPARLWRGVCRIGLGREEAGLGDLQDMVRAIREKENPPAKLRDEALEALSQAEQILSAAGNCDGALELMAWQQDLQPKPPAAFFAELGKLFERRAAQLNAQLADAKPSERAEREQKVRDLRAKAGDAFIAHSRALTLRDDKGYGIAMWKGIELYEAAADIPRVIAALEMFVGERPDDPQTPDAMLRLGHSYHAAGLFDKAIAAYRQCQFRYPKSLAASKSGVPLARTFIAKGPEEFRKAEEALRSVIENNPQITPEAQEFREALEELAHLYYRTARYELAISRLEELTQRYPADEKMGQLLFVMADSYRKSAEVLGDQIKSASATTRPAIDVADAAKAWDQRLTRARDLYLKVIDSYRTVPASRPLDKLYLKLSYFYRADCVFDLGSYADAIKMYDDAAFRYQDDPSALAAYVQIVNANVALGRLEEARAANERAKWMLRRMPSQVFDATSFNMPKGSWEQWLKWSGESGVWK